MVEGKASGGLSAAGAGSQKLFTPAPASRGGGWSTRSLTLHCSVFWFSRSIFPTGMFWSRRRLAVRLCSGLTTGGRPKDGVAGAGSNSVYGT